MPIDEKIKAYRILERIKEHFRYHHYCTIEDLEQFAREEYQAEVRRGIVKLEGNAPEIESFDFVDLP